MSDPGDYELDTFEKHDTADLTADLAGRSRTLWPWLVALAVVLALAAAWIYWRYVTAAPAPEVAAPTAPAPEEPAPAPVAIEAIDLPPLAESDPWLRDVVGQLSENPQLLTWLLNDDLVRRLVAAVDNVAEGVSPRSHVVFLQPRGAYQADGTGDRLKVDAASYRRYETLAAVITSLHVDGTAQAYRTVKPLLDEAYRDLGYPGADFDAVAVRAIQRLLDTPVVPEPELERFASSYKYADPRLEALDDAQKQFLRLGPENLRAIQAHVRRIAERAGLAVR
ncbi:MAG: DUF3014 domain-containing protein [Acidobacteriota bacterium]|nr:DUF3014 domain-containing protein [Acidobacteriota bacterium]MDH3522156.1 DUF3014 domain-containing protein [Acidobacteriota bacterium]